LDGNDRWSLDTPDIIPLPALSRTFHDEQIFCRSVRPKVSILWTQKIRRKVSLTRRRQTISADAPPLRPQAVVRGKMIYDESSVNDFYEKNLEEAKCLLMSLPFCCGDQPSFSGLTGWVFEKTIQHCIRRELKEMKLEADIEEQACLLGRAKVDLRVGTTAIEIKTSGLFSREDIFKYQKYKTEAEAKGWRYIFLSIGETTFRQGIIEALGKENVVLLYEYDGSWSPSNGEWQRLMEIVAEGVTAEKQNHKR